MYRLVCSIHNFLIPRFLRLHYDMDSKRHEKLPDKHERKIKRQTIQQTVHQKVVPVFSFRFRNKIRLDDVIPHKMAHYQLKHSFANFLVWHFFCSFLFLSYILQYAEKLRQREAKRRAGGEAPPAVCFYVVFVVSALFFCYLFCFFFSRLAAATREAVTTNGIAYGNALSKRKRYFYVFKKQSRLTHDY